MTIRVRIENLEGAQGKDLFVETGERTIRVEPGKSSEVYVYKGKTMLVREDLRTTNRRRNWERRYSVEP